LIRFDASDSGERTVDTIVSAIVIALSVVDQHIILQPQSRTPCPNAGEIKTRFARGCHNNYDELGLSDLSRLVLTNKAQGVAMVGGAGEEL
jgi:hypothetical protein